VISLKALRIHLSPECKQILDELGGYLLEERGEVSMKVCKKAISYGKLNDLVCGIL
jgi:atrial natriuretic peptide receptor A